MRTLVHLSDLHFGRTDAAILRPLAARVAAIGPDVVVVSGDLTQRARIAEFRQARAFLDRLPTPQIVVPGNHDVPLYNVFKRFFEPLDNYKRYITDDLTPFYSDEEVAVLGINTARSLTIKDGRINHDQMDMIRKRFAPVPPEKTRILVTHHPLFAMPIGKGGELSEAVGRHDDAVEAAAEAGIHIALAGHFHRTYAEAAQKMVADAGGALVIQAGTATSTRLRNAEPQSFNWLHVHRNDRIELQVIVWDGASFQRGHHVEYSRDAAGWQAHELDDPSARPGVRVAQAARA